MTVVIVVLLVGAALLLALGVQVVSSDLQRFGVDTRPPGPIVESTRTGRFVARPAELDTIRSIVEESLVSPTVTEAKLGPLLQRLDENAPRRRSPDAGSDIESEHRPRSMRPMRGRGRAATLRAALDDLEHRWGLERPRS
ncbi:MAG: hypothetical protein AAGD35_05590 [Actinomycetota bacterium]